MINKKIVREALKNIQAMENFPNKKHLNLNGKNDKEVSLLIHDIFGGEILKTPNKVGWHFYNWIQGERLDFTDINTGKSLTSNHFEDIPATTEETNLYFEQEDYASFYMKFIRVFEELVGFRNYRSEYAS